MLEGQMQEMRDLPQRVTSLELQIVQLRQEMRDEFSATRAEFRSDLAQAVTTLRSEMATKKDLAQAMTTLRSEMATKKDLAQAMTTLRSEMATKKDLAQAMTTLRSEMATKDDLAQGMTILRGEMATKENLTRAVAALRGEIAGAVSTLTKAIGETNAQMRMLHEETLSRIATIGEGRRPGKRR